MSAKPKIGINCMVHNPCETCNEKPARFVIKNKFTNKKLKICEDCKKLIIDNK